MSDTANHAAGQFLDVTIAGREYRIACPPDEQPALQAAVRLLDARMRDVAAKSKGASAERVAVMAALNLAHDYLALTAPQGDTGASGIFDTAAVRRRMAAMEAQLDLVLR